jgi:hypothetical protein
MALTDWDRVNAASTMGLSTQQVFDGKRSLLMDAADGRPEIDKIDTRQAQPKVGSIRSYLWAGGGLAQADFAFRLDRSIGQEVRVKLNWDKNQVGLISDDGSTRQKTTRNMSDPPTQQWLEVEAFLWESGGGLNARIDVDGQTKGSDLSVSLKPPGGAWGLQSSGSDILYWDNTELYY